MSERAGLTFAVGLRSILRQDPNVVMVGEIRDKETAQVAFQAAQTGHLVLSTLHTNDAPSSVTRLVEMGVPAYVVASSLIGVVAQRLVRRVCTCRTSRVGPDASPGCEVCGFSGFKGRIAVHELLKVTPRVRTALLGHANGDLLRETACATGMKTMFEDGERKVARGVTTVEELRRVVPPREIDDSVVPVEATRDPGHRHLVMLSPPKPAAPRQPRILVVDDDVMWTDRIKSVLVTESYDVMTANTPADVFAAVQRDQPELVVMELRGMPGLAGLDFLRKLRSSVATHRTGVIFLTNVDDPDAEVRALDAGADDYLRAPVSPELLLGRIRRAMLRTHLLANAG